MEKDCRRRIAFKPFPLVCLLSLPLLYYSFAFTDTSNYVFFLCLFAFDYSYRSLMNAYCILTQNVWYEINMSYLEIMAVKRQLSTWRSNIGTNEGGLQQHELLRFRLGRLVRGFLLLLLLQHFVLIQH